MPPSSAAAGASPTPASTDASAASLAAISALDGRPRFLPGVTVLGTPPSPASAVRDV
jgi:hypothetical protein